MIRLVAFSSVSKSAKAVSPKFLYYPLTCITRGTEQGSSEPIFPPGLGFCGHGRDLGRSVSHSRVKNGTKKDALDKNRGQVQTPLAALISGTLHYSGNIVAGIKMERPDP